MDAGRMDKRAAIMRRPVIRDDQGEDTGDRGPYGPAFTIWANFRPESAREAAQGGRAQNVETAILTVRDSANARSITNGERVTVQGREFNVKGVGLPNRLTGLIAFNLSSDLGGE